MERKRMLQLFKELQTAWGSFDDFPALPPGIDPMPHISRNTISQPFFLVSDQDHTLINLTGEGEIWFAAERAPLRAAHRGRGAPVRVRVSALSSRDFTVPRVRPRGPDDA